MTSFKAIAHGQDMEVTKILEIQVRVRSTEVTWDLDKMDRQTRNLILPMLGRIWQSIKVNWFENMERILGTQVSCPDEMKSSRANI